MSSSQRIKPISYLKAHAAEIVRTLREESEPYVITQNGEAKAVLLGYDDYRRKEETFALLKSLAIGTHQVETGQVEPADKVITRLREQPKAL